MQDIKKNPCLLASLYLSLVKILDESAYQPGFGITKNSGGGMPLGIPTIYTNGTQYTVQSMGKKLSSEVSPVQGSSLCDNRKKMRNDQDKDKIQSPFTVNCYLWRTRRDKRTEWKCVLIYGGCYSGRHIYAYFETLSVSRYLQPVGTCLLEP